MVVGKWDVKTTRFKAEMSLFLFLVASKFLTRLFPSSFAGRRRLLNRSVDPARRLLAHISTPLRGARDVAGGRADLPGALRASRPRSVYLSFSKNNQLMVG